MDIKDILVERYRPTKLEDLVLQQEHRDYFSERIKLQDIPHLLFVGSPGTGKCLDGDEVIEIYISDKFKDKLQKNNLLE